MNQKNNEFNENSEKRESQLSQKVDVSNFELQRTDKKSFSSPIQDFEKPNKKKRKAGISFLVSPEKLLTPFIERNASFNLLSNKIEEVNSESESINS